MDLLYYKEGLSETGVLVSSGDSHSKSFSLLVMPPLQFVKRTVRGPLSFFHLRGSREMGTMLKRVSHLLAGPVTAHPIKALLLQTWDPQQQRVLPPWSVFLQEPR